MSNKICTQCNIDKSFTEFNKKRGGLDWKCRSCQKEYNKKYYLKNHKSSHYKKRIKESSEKYFKYNKDKIKIKRRIWYDKNRKTINAKRSLYLSKRRKDDILFRLKSSLTASVSQCLKHKGIKKETKTLVMLGLSLKEFKIHLENLFTSEMNWNNYGSYWHIDHIIPISSGNTTIEIYKLCYYTNLRPLEKLENILKSNKII